MKIKRFDEYNSENSIAIDFLYALDKEMIKESGENKESFNRFVKKITSDLKLNLGFVSTFGLGLAAIFPIVEKLMKNMGIESFNMSGESIVLLVLTVASIIYLEEKKFKDSREEDGLIRDSKSMLEELKMRGFGNGIVKKLIKAVKSIKNLFTIIYKHIGSSISGIMDMFAYTSLLFPVLNGIMFVIGKYDLNLDTLIQNFRGLAIGIGTLIAKHGIVRILNKIKSKFPINKKAILDEIETPAIQKFSTFGDSEKNKQNKQVDLIKEQ